MILCDTGPLVAMIDRNDPNHERCVSAARGLPPTRLLITWPCFTETMYLLGRSGGYTAQERLWEYGARRALELHVPAAGEIERMRTLMRQYADAPMDLADASIVAAAERLNLSRVFTLDSHFHAYRTASGHFELVP